jgi:heme exporter protein C
MQGAWWKVGSGLLMICVILAAFLVVKPVYGFREGGDTARAVFFHVPSAVLSSVCYFVGMFFAAGYLFTCRYRSLDIDARSAISMELGFLFCLLATITGSVFAGMQWGVFWNWDPRETSIVVMLLLYAAYLILRGAMAENPTARARISAVYAIVALVPAQYLVWAVPRLMRGNHPVDVLQTPSNNSLDYNVVLYMAFLAFTLLFIWLFQLRLRSYRLTATSEERT